MQEAWESKWLEVNWWEDISEGRDQSAVLTSLNEKYNS